MRTEKLEALEVTRAMRKREPGMLNGLDMSWACRAGMRYR